MPAWLILGIVISFMGELADNLFWNGAWAAYHAKGVDHERWMRYGPVSNSIFRQLFCVVAAACHVVPVILKKEIRKSVVVFSLMLSLFLFWLLSHLGQRKSVVVFSLMLSLFLFWLLSHLGQHL
jgi:Ca2+/Na+ antiporter